MSDADNRTPTADIEEPGPGVDTLVTAMDPQSEHPEGMESILWVLKGPEPGKIFALEGATHIIGRDPDASVAIADPGLSREHARINRTAHGDYIEDLGSTNGTLVNGEKLERFHALQEADRIQLGKVILRYGRRDRLEQEAARQVYERTVRDGLTQLYNRRFLDDRLPGEFAYAKRHRVDLCVLLLDVDHFKKINDTLGHPAGDEALRQLARSLADTTREEDILARYGGEEFTVVALGIDLNGGLAFAERLRSSVERLAVIWKGEPLPLTVSIGVAHNVTSDQWTVEGLFAAADSALYQAKRDGRNSVHGDQGYGSDDS